MKNKYLGTLHRSVLLLNTYMTERFYIEIWSLKTFS